MQSNNLISSNHQTCFVYVFKMQWSFLNMGDYNIPRRIACNDCDGRLLLEHAFIFQDFRRLKFIISLINCGCFAVSTFPLLSLVNLHLTVINYFSSIAIISSSTLDLLSFFVPSHSHQLLSVQTQHLTVIFCFVTLESKLHTVGMPFQLFSSN